MRGLEEVELNWWEQNLHHLPQAPVPHAEICGSAELPAGGKSGPQHLARHIPQRRACSGGVNNLLRIPHATFRVSWTEKPCQCPLGAAHPPPPDQEGWGFLLHPPASGKEADLHYPVLLHLLMNKGRSKNT